LLFDWASAQRSGQRLALWVVIALFLHAGAYLLLRVTYPPADPVRISEAALYVLLPGSPEEKRLTPFIEAANPALFAPEDPHGLAMPAPPMPAYEPSYAAAKPQLVPMPENPARVLPPLLPDFGPISMPEAAAPAPQWPAPATGTQIVFSRTLEARAPQEWPAKKFTARPGDLLAPMQFLIAVAPDGRVLHVFRDPDSAGDDNKAIDDAASRYLMSLWFRRGPNSGIVWGSATFHWGLDVKREELR
jgi:hypothetical protein